MSIRTLSLLSVLASATLMMGVAQAQGFVFGTAKPKPEAAETTGARHAQVETAQRLLARMGLFRESPSGTLTPATLRRFAIFPCKTG